MEAFGVGPGNDEIAPHGCVVYYDFPARGSRPPVRLTWYDGGAKPATPAAVRKFPLALRMRRPVDWDAENMQAKGLPAADAFIRGSYRAGWEIV